MDEEILTQILNELRGLRRGQDETNRRLDHTVQHLDQTVQRLESLERTTNTRLESLENHLESLERTTNERFESLERRFDGLQASVQVLTQGFSDVRYELVEIKKLLATRVIWTNDNVSIQVREGETIYGIIRKEEKKE